MGSISFERFHVTATGHSLNYLPEYIAHRRGFFHAQGLDVSVTVPQPWDRVLDDLADGSAEAALGGIWVPSMYRNRVRRYTAFAQVANKAPLALVGRGRPEEFKLEDLVGKTVLMKGSNGASVGLYLKMLLREHGIDPRTVKYIQDLDGAMLAALFAGGMGDYLFVDNLSARVLASKNAHIAIVLETCREDLDIPWSVYYRETATITPAVLDAQRRFCIALGQGMEWLLNRDAESYRDDLEALFPRVSSDITVALANEFRRHNMWTTPVISRDGYERWQRGIADGFLVGEPLKYEDVVDDGPAKASRKKAGNGGSLGSGETLIEAVLA